VVHFEGKLMGKETISKLAALLPALKESRRRASPGGVVWEVPVRTPDGIGLDCSLISGDPLKAIVVAHPAVVGSRYRQVVALADELARSYSVFLFDFRGHGASGGKCMLGFSGAAVDLAAVVRRARGLGFQKVGVAGFSMGAGAAFLAAAGGAKIDAIASIGCPPSFPDLAPWRDHPHLTKGALRFLGLRLDPRIDRGPAPIEVVAGLEGFPKLLIFGEWEVAPAEDIDRFTEAVSPPAEKMVIEGAWHADLKGNEAGVREWFGRAM
jgi:pimeloyl-ACP methyl ester carboxylesterase